jgi:hypothetical protein
MTDTDLTRWNRAGLTRFQYVDANAVTLLEELRQGLNTRFGGTTWTARAGDAPEEEQYVSTPIEWGWQLSRALARASHVLLGYVDAYANEGYLQTATQWENVRRLVSMLGYRPAPPSSASTALALSLKPGSSGTVPRGLAVRYAPPDGGPPIVFETLADVAGDAGLNSLRIVGYGTSQQPLTGVSLALESTPAGLRSGDPIVLEDVAGAERLEAHIVSAVSGTELTLAEPIGTGFIAGQTLVHAVPAERLKLLGPRQTGTAQLPTALQLAPGAPSLTTGDVVIISDTAHTVYRRVTGFRGPRVVLDAAVGTMDLTTATLSRPAVVAVQAYAPARTTRAGAALFLWRVAGDLSHLVGTTVAVTAPGITEYQVIAADYTPVTTPATGSGASSNAPPPKHAMLLPGTTRLTVQRVDGGSTPPGNPQKILVPPATPGPWRLDGLLARRQRSPGSGRGSLPTPLIVTRPKHAGPGDLIVLVRAGQSAWARLEGVDELDAGRSAALRTAPLQERGGGAFYLSDSTVFAGFKSTARPAGWQVNTTPVPGASLQLSQPPTGILPGRRLLLIRGDDPTKSLVTSVVSVGTDQIVLADSTPPGTTVDNLEIAGNVAVAGHGNTRPTLKLGSGDATQSRQSFAINVTDVSWIDDTTMPNGVRADLTVTVGGEIWVQVGALDRTGPTDAVYEVQIREDGSLLVVFGDGQNGRRLPTGVNNVSARYRSGVGLAGNLGPGSIHSLVAPDPLVASVRQPLPASGGSDPEGVDSMRARAPATLLALGRAVSLPDFGFLAASQSGVWQAQALPAVEQGTGEKVTVVIVPAGGWVMSPTLKSSIEGFLTSRAIPGVAVSAVDYTRARLSISVRLDVDTVHYETATVIAAVGAAVTSAFTLPTRELGQPVHRSDVFRVVEGVPGVADCECYIARDADVPDPLARVQRLRADAREVLTLDDNGQSLSVTTGAVR